MKKNNIQKLLSGICVGLGVGACMGVAMDNILTGLMLGMGIGLCFSTAFGAFRHEPEEQDGQDGNSTQDGTDAKDDTEQ